MLSVLIANADGQEAKRLLAGCRQSAARYTDEEMECTVCLTTPNTRKALEKAGPWDLHCLDLELPEGLSLAKLAREESPGGFIVLIAPADLSPVEYLCPSILPGGLLLRPYTLEQVNQVLGDAVSARLDQINGEKCFVVESREGSERISYRKIEYFEAREKKLVAVTQSGEYSFYGTISHLEKIVPDQFVRCHRSYIVRCDAVQKLQLSKNMLTLKSGEILPVSRSYKPVLKEALK